MVASGKLVLEGWNTLGREMPDVLHRLKGNYFVFDPTGVAGHLPSQKLAAISDPWVTELHLARIRIETIEAAVDVVAGQDAGVGKLQGDVETRLTPKRRQQDVGLIAHGLENKRHFAVVFLDVLEKLLDGIVRLLSEQALDRVFELHPASRLGLRVEVVCVATVFIDYQNALINCFVNAR